ncbi:MAG TPA: CHC2 zinc finger domain-containing protein [Terriglobales bacterium]|jgi:hypothetical protein|nr:CHC2 zinc finger domain-containing protein [Terriglobales bacterium]
MSAPEILARCQRVRRSGDGWVAQCPAHADRNPSLSIRESEAKIQLHCFVGCTVETIGAALKIKISDLLAVPGAVQAKSRAVRDAKRQIADLRSGLTSRERVLPLTVVYCERENQDAGIARALAVEGELVQAVPADPQ